MIYDCFLFNDELEVLEIRLHELKDVVDEFVLIEADGDFHGRSKALTFAENVQRFSRFNVRHHMVLDIPEGDPVEGEKLQRMALRSVLPKMHDDDIVMWSDVDEIPNSNVVNRFVSRKCSVANIQLFHHVGFLNWRRHDFYYHSKIVTGRFFEEASNGHDLRWGYAHADVLQESGWHFNYLGGLERIKKKVNAGAHRRENVTVDRMLRRYEKFGIQYCESFAMKVPLVEPHLPKYVIENKNLYHEMGFLL
jgi:beta-1,4-mannosyl-glycoprotein beta-1,4-N-acetylglucosaminyltransferase